jgi:hypothetical protein
VGVADDGEHDLDEPWGVGQCEELHFGVVDLVGGHFCEQFSDVLQVCVHTVVYIMRSNQALLW